MHPVVRNYLEAHLDGSLLPPARRELESHLRDCATCRKDVEEARLTNEWMQALVTELMMPAPGFYARVRARVESEGSQVWPFWQLMPVFSRQLGFALFATLMLLSGYFFTLRITEDQAHNTVAELMLDAPAIRTEAPALTAADAHSNRQRVMLALIAPAKAEGD